MTPSGIALVFFAAVLALVACVPVPGGYHGHHEHHLVHVPYHVHTVHHHHVKKVVVPVPIIKKVIVHEPHFIHAHHHIDAHHVHGGGWW